MKTPWSLIGWLLAGLLGLLISLGLYYLGLTLGWIPWLAPALLWAPLALAALVRLAVWIIARPKAVPTTILDPSNPFTGQWEAIKSGLGAGVWDLYLVVGDDDALKRSFLSRALGQAEYQAAPAGPEGLSLWAADGRAWLNVPAALWRESARSETLPQALGGDWAHLLKLLPAFPGPLSGLAVLADPAQKDSAAQGFRLARKLQGLAGRTGAAPPWWLILYPLERLASGQRLVQALELLPEAGADLWRRPFGLFFPEKTSGSPSQKMKEAQSYLAGQLNRTLIQIDRWPGAPALSSQIFSLADEFRRLPLDYLAEVEGHKKAAKLKCDGLFLALEAPHGPGQFTELLLRDLIPARRSGGGPASARRTRRLIWGGALLASLTALALLAAGHWQGRRTLTLAADVFPVLARIERHPAAPPPVDSLAAAADLVLDMKRRSSGPAGFYHAPEEAVRRARSGLAGQLNRYLPDQYAEPDPFILALAGWADHRAAPLVFKYPDGRITVPGPAVGNGRERVAELARKWDAVLEKAGPPESDRLLSHYDQMVFDRWRVEAETLALGLAATPEKIQLSGRAGLYGQAVGLEFLKAVGSELSFKTWREIPGWIMAARELEIINSLGSLGDLDDDGRELASVIRRLKHGGTPLGADGVEKAVGAARAWKKYEAAVYGLASLAESPKGLTLLAEEMYSGAPPPPERASLAGLRQMSGEALAELMKIAPITSEPERELFETLFLSPVDWLTGSAAAAAAVSLEEEWRRKIVLPSKDLSEAEKAALLLGEEGAVAAFRDGPARPYLVAGAKGYEAKEVFGLKFPWSGDFLKFINASQEGWKKAAGSDGRLAVSALLRPVRAEGSRLAGHPLGVALDMVCEADRFKAETYNRPATFAAQWSPKCEPLRVTVVFRDFKLVKSYDGPAGFTAFIRAAVRGEVRYGPDDFPDQRHLMKAVGAESVVLSLDVDKGGEILKALTTPAPVLKPPSAVIADSDR